MRSKDFLFIFLIGLTALISNSCQKDKLDSLSGTIWISDMTSSKIYKLDFIDESNLIKTIETYHYRWIFDTYEPGVIYTFETKYIYDYPDINVSGSDLAMKLKGNAINFDGIACYRQ